MSYQHFIQKFPATKLPITLTEESARIFSTENEPLPHKLINEYILPYDEDYDDLTEYVPCMQLEGLKNFDAIIYWKASLMNYQYVLMTFEKGGKAIHKKHWQAHSPMAMPSSAPLPALTMILPFTS